ncbi:MAG: FkbM family methyltransferase [Kaiparowitsia implicata GSE-PSE-MK54-09C]|jgi:FkbM family methyltransferase|nr:FkbM family methyltransferase [Kaiparowitsia implicata GSE-PSE-MK54-09C]
MLRVTLPNGLDCFCLSIEETEWIYAEVFTECHYLRHGISLQDGDCVVDVGANIGMFAVFLSTRFPKSTVYSFEPMPFTFEVLEHNLDLHSATNVTALNVGLSDGDRTDVPFTFYPNLPGNSTIHPLEKKEHLQVLGAAMGNTKVAFLFEPETVKGEVRSLSSIIREQEIDTIDLLKVDVEGEEYGVLQGIADRDWPRIRQVVLEVHDVGDRLAHITTLLKQNGFSVFAECSPFSPYPLNQHYVYGVRN